MQKQIIWVRNIIFMVNDRRKERFPPKETDFTSFIAPLLKHRLWILSQYAAGLALAAGDVPVVILSGREVRALQGHWPRRGRQLLAASALVLHLQVAVQHDAAERQHRGEAGRWGMSPGPAYKINQ